MAHLPWHSLCHRFARWMIDRFGLEAGELMAVGGWENIATVENRYYKGGQEHEERALDRVERGWSAASRPKSTVPTSCRRAGRDWATRGDAIADMARRPCGVGPVGVTPAAG